jgi:hypothetical protein
MDENEKRLPLRQDGHTSDGAPTSRADSQAQHLLLVEQKFGDRQSSTILVVALSDDP